MNIIEYTLNYKNAVKALFDAHTELYTDAELTMIDCTLEEVSSEQVIKIIALEEDSVVGFATLRKRDDTDETWEVYWVVVDPLSKRKKVGSGLVTELEFRAKVKFVRNLIVVTCSCEGELPARKFYEHLGFHKKGELPNYYNEGHSQVIYYKQLH